ncbi:MAG: biotin/lipoyl-binding protein, partial [Deltaproteobacteria bacterium]
MKTLKRVLPLIVILALVGAALVYLSRVTPAEGGPLTASGTVEAVQVLVAPESGGRVLEVLADEGDTVQAGDPLLRLDDELLQAQKRAAQTALEAAQANLEVARAAHETALAAVKAAQAQYDLTLYQARQADATARRTAWNAGQPADFKQPVWYFQKSEQVTAVQAEVEAARAALQAEEENLKRVLQASGGEKLTAAEERLAAARQAFLLADDLLARAQAQSDATLEARAQELYNAASAELDAAQLAYDRLLTNAAMNDVLEARARLAVARERYESALDRYNQLLTGEDSPQVQAAWATLQQAQAAAAQAEAAITQAEK